MDIRGPRPGAEVNVAKSLPPRKRPGIDVSISLFRLCHNRLSMSLCQLRPYKMNTLKKFHVLVYEGDPFFFFG